MRRHESTKPVQTAETTAQRQKDKGLIFLQKWVTPQEKAAIDSMVKAMRAQSAQRKEAA